jgi:hypothetical protein
MLPAAWTQRIRKAGDPGFSQCLGCFPFWELRESTLRGTRGSDCGSASSAAAPLRKSCGLGGHRGGGESGGGAGTAASRQESSEI